MLKSSGPNRARVSALVTLATLSGFSLFSCSSDKEANKRGDATEPDKGSTPAPKVESSPPTIDIERLPTEVFDNSPPPASQPTTASAKPVATQPEKEVSESIPPSEEDKTERVRTRELRPGRDFAAHTEVLSKAAEQGISIVWERQGGASTFRFVRDGEELLSFEVDHTEVNKADIGQELAAAARSVCPIPVSLRGSELEVEVDYRQFPEAYLVLEKAGQVGIETGLEVLNRDTPGELLEVQFVRDGEVLLRLARPETGAEDLDRWLPLATRALEDLWEASKRAGPPVEVVSLSGGEAVYVDFASYPLEHELFEQAYTANVAVTFSEVPGGVRWEFAGEGRPSHSLTLHRTNLDEQDLWINEVAVALNSYVEERPPELTPRDFVVYHPEGVPDRFLESGEFYRGREMFIPAEGEFAVSSIQERKGERSLDVSFDDHPLVYLTLAEAQFRGLDVVFDQLGTEENPTLYFRVYDGDASKMRLKLRDTTLEESKDWAPQLAEALEQVLTEDALAHETLYIPGVQEGDFLELDYRSLPTEYRAFQAARDVGLEMVFSNDGDYLALSFYLDRELVDEVSVENLDGFSREELLGAGFAALKRLMPEE